jgi:protein-L-isoaspartate(D-aspartate) O-methyltransferase
VRLDAPKHKGQRRAMVSYLKEKGIGNQKVLDVFKSVPRHLFLDSTLESHAYEDKAFPIGAEQTISHPYTVAFQTELLQVNSGMKILEIGTGSGFQTAILIALGAEVYTIERQLELYRKCDRHFSIYPPGPKKLIYGDGYKGYLKEAPYDRIIVTAGAPEIPKELLKQLKVGGILVIPVGEEQQKMIVLERKGTKEFHQTVYGDFQFVPLLKETAGVKK